VREREKESRIWFMTASCITALSRNRNWVIEDYLNLSTNEILEKKCRDYGT
jgi:hypothetical protein